MLARRVDGNPLIYLDNAATSLKPQPVIDAMNHYYTHVSANIHRGKHMLSEEASDAYEAARYAVSRFLDCQSREVVFVQNTTHALGMVAAGLDLTSDDLVLCPLDVHHSNLLPWWDRARVEFIRVDDNGMIDLDHYRTLLAKGPKVVALNHCSNVTGVIAPVEEMSRQAKAVDAIVVLDAAQSAPHRRLRVRELGCDFAAFSGHKMLGPTGVGILYVGEQQFERLKATQLGGGTVDWVDTEHYELRKVPHRFEGGTPNISGVYGFGAALTYLNTIGMAAVEEHDRAMADLLASEAAERPTWVMLGARSTDRVGIASLKLPGLDNLGDAARILSDSYGVMCRTGHMCAQPLVEHFAMSQVLRMSTYVYNTQDEIQRAFSALDRICFDLGVNRRH